MLEVIDLEERKKNSRSRNLFSRLSFWIAMGWITIVFLGNLTFNWCEFGAAKGYSPLWRILWQLTVLALTVAGPISTILAFTKAEPPSLFKYTGLMLNVLVVLSAMTFYMIATSGLTE